jgi:hypothetical protein
LFLEFHTKTPRTCWPGPQFVGTVPTTTGGTDTGVFSNQCIGTFFATTKRFRHGTHGVGRTTDRSGLHPCQPPSVVVVVTSQSPHTNEREKIVSTRTQRQYNHTHPTHRIHHVTQKAPYPSLPCRPETPNRCRSPTPRPQFVQS